ncbi:hypothetical protein [Parasedimentitalea maritima]|uniref:Uncharacterized protein n=1 Tax=Parasedimentitalea maritima TaxID=2578117 RepID=A0A6A4RIV5_9RHOB|nr:hypothetical protein [Zongyanglinia marina]KAE9629361.1 hypothetical protein GP644_13170 [Zongyanglinia marina]
MVVGILALAVIFGGALAGAALVTGHSFLFALAIYMGAGSLSVFVIASLIFAGSALRNFQLSNLNLG